jgi:hypothetical protein
MAGGLMARPDYSRTLPRPLAIPGVMKLKTLADVRDLMRHLPQETRAKATWRYVADRLDEAAKGADPVDVAMALRLVLNLERVAVKD